MTEGLSDHLWSIKESLKYKVAPTRFVPVKKRGRPRKAVEAADQAVPVGQKKGQTAQGDSVMSSPLIIDIPL